MLRTYRPDHRVFWDDEVYTTIKVLGLSEADARVRVAAIHDVRSVRQLLHPEPFQFRLAPLGTVRALASDEPQHPPLYYLLAQAWVTIFGASVLSLRMLSVSLGLLAIPLAYALCRELFGTRLSGLLGAALFALSPVQIVYAQEIREYCMWSVAILGSSYLFLRAWRLTTRSSWFAYSLSLALAFYIDPLSVLLVVAHGVSLMGANAKSTRASTLRFFGASVSLAFVAFLPWLVVIATRGSQVHRSMATIVDARIPFGRVVRAILKAIRIDSLDFNTENRTILNLLLTAVVAVIVGGSFAYLARNATAVQRWFVVSLTALTSAPIVLLDIIFSGKRVESVGYFIPFYVGVDLGLVFLCSNLVMSTSAKSPQRATASAFIGLLLVARLSVGIADARSETWWNDYNIHSIDIARVINASTAPFVASDAYLGFSLSVLEYVAPKTGIYLRPRCYLCTIPPSREEPEELIAHAGDDVYLLGPTPALQAMASAALRRTHHVYRCVDIRGSCKSDLNLY